MSKLHALPNVEVSRKKKLAIIGGGILAGAAAIGIVLYAKTERYPYS